MIGEHNYNTYEVNKKLVKEKVSAHDLRVGMYVVELDRPWIDTPFLFQGFLVYGKTMFVSFQCTILLHKMQKH